MRRSPSTFLPLLLAALLSACATFELDDSPPFYEDLAKPGAEVNVVAAASLLSDYRRANGLPAVAPDGRLAALARDQARRMAAAGRVSHGAGGRGFAARLKAANYDAAHAAENVGAGYRTLAEAFSGWRDSPSHNMIMLLPGATRFGIASVYAPDSRYKVFWALVLAEPAQPR